MFLVEPLMIVTPEYESIDAIIENENTVRADQIVFLFGDQVIMNGEFTILGQMVII